MVHRSGNPFLPSGVGGRAMRKVIPVSLPRFREGGAKAILLFVTAVLLIGAGPPPSPEDLLRSASEAFYRRDLDSAELLYQQAEDRTLDPGLVAFNKGMVLYRRGDFRKAELCFRRTLGDAAIPRERRAKALYNLGNTLVQQAGEKDMKLLQAAIECYEMTIRETGEQGTKDDASDNLELAKLLWAKARAKRPADERDPDWEQPREPKDPPPDPKKQPEPGTEKIDDGSSKQDSGAKAKLAKDLENGTTAKEVPKTVPVRGNLPVIPDTDEVPSLSTEDARAVLKKAADRLQRERQKLRAESTQGERPRANDW